MVVELHGLGQGRAEVRRHFGHGRGVTEVGLQRLARHLVGAHSRSQPLRQDVVAPQLVDDRPLDPGGGIRRELEASGRIEAFNRIDKPELAKRAELID